jgi:hypothetical protein
VLLLLVDDAPAQHLLEGWGYICAVAEAVAIMWLWVVMLLL